MFDGLHTFQSVKLCSIVLIVLLAVIFVVVSIIDFRSHRIPNVIILPLLLFGLIYYTVTGQWAGFLFSLKGMGIGFLVLFIPYLMGGMGAGDVKFMSALGAVLGPQQILPAFLFAAILGGFVALAVMVKKRTVINTFKRLGTAFLLFCSGAGITAFKDKPRRPGEGIPYGPVIAAGTFASIIWQLAVQGIVPFAGP